MEYIEYSADYLEYSASNGPGTLISHGVAGFNNFTLIDYTFCTEKFDPFTQSLKQFLAITPERYAEFIEIHGGERAV